MTGARSTAALGLALALAGCGGGAEGTGPARSAALAAPAGLAARIEVAREDERPPVTTVAREGDPHGALAVALWIDETTASAAPALAAVLEARLARSEIDVSVRVADGAILLDLALLGPPGPVWARVRGALASPVRADELPPVAQRSGEWAGVTATPGLEAASRCAGLAIAPPATPGAAAPASAPQVEHARQTTMVAARVSVGAVGAGPFVEEVREALAADAPWPTGSPPGRGALGLGPSTFVRRGARDEASPDLIVTRALSRAEQAPAIARALAEGRGPLASRLRLLPSGLEIEGVTGLSRAGGGGSCLRVDLRAARPDALDAEGAARAARLLEGETDVAPAGAEEAGARAILEADDPREAATRAAWWAAAASGPARSELGVALAIPTDDGGATRARLERALAGPAAIEAEPLERAIRVEAGQGALRVLLGSPCAPALGGTASAAETAIALVAAARRAEPGVTLRPVLGDRGAGLLAEATPRRGEGPLALADRVARALVAALAGPPPSHAELGEARGRLVALASRQWGHPEGADAFVRSLAPERPTAIAPLGLEVPLMRAEAAGVSRRLAALLRAPLRVAVLANADAAQGEAVAAALARHLPPSSPGPCPAQPPAPAPTAGRTDVRMAGDEPFAELWLGVRASSPAAADAALALLSAQDAPLASTAARLGASARPHLLGDRSIAIDVRVAPERTEETVRAVLEALSSISRRAPEPGLAAQLTRAARAASHARAADPRRRLERLWLGAAPEAPPEKEIDPRAVAAELDPARWVLVVAQPG